MRLVCGMEWLDAARDVNARTDDWFRAHPVVWFVVATVVPGGVLAGFMVVASDRQPIEALLFGLLYGIVYAGLTIYWNRE